MNVLFYVSNLMDQAEGEEPQGENNPFLDSAAAAAAEEETF